jgi:hypothetical protein
MRHAVNVLQANDADPIPNEAWFASKDGQIMVCEVPASAECGPWHAVFVKSALGWETERDAVTVPEVGTCWLNRHSIGWSGHGASSSVPYSGR